MRYTAFVAGMRSFHANMSTAVTRVLRWQSHDAACTPAQLQTSMYVVCSKTWADSNQLQQQQP